MAGVSECNDWLDGSTSTARIERPHSDRARSGSKGMPWLRDRPPTATPTPHTPSQSSTVPPHRRMEDQVQAAYRRRPLNR